MYMATFCQCGLPSENFVIGCINCMKLQHIGTSSASTRVLLHLKFERKTTSINKSSIINHLITYIKIIPAIIQRGEIEIAF